MQGEGVRGCFFIAHLELAEEIEPAVRHFDDPAARFEPFVFLGLDLLATRAHMRDLAMAADNGVSLFPDIPGIGAQVLNHGLAGAGLAGDLAVQHRAQLADIMAVGANQREAQRHALLIHQQMPPRAVFSPDPWGFCQRRHHQ